VSPISHGSPPKSSAKVRISQKLIWIFQAAGLWLFWLACSTLSPDRASTIGRRLAKTFGPHLSRTWKIKRNLSLAFPEKTEAEVAELAREVWGNVGAVLAEYPHLRAIGENRDGLRIETVIKADIEALRSTGKPAVFVSGHLGNWELPTTIALDMGVPLSVIHTEQDNPLVHGMIQRKRTALGCGFVSKEAGLRPVIRLLENGTSVGLLPDVKIPSGELVPFFGKDAHTTTNPAKLALKFGCDLIPVQVERLHGARFRITFHEPVRPDDPQADRNTQALQMTRKVNGLFESWIQNRPFDWWCPKNRWPKVNKAGNRVET
jgi:KDO2-lipid IV(A) lauroyltransferase